MAITETDAASAAIIESTAAQFLTGKRSISRAFIKEALAINLVGTREASQIMGVQETQLNRAVLQTGTPKKLRPLVQLIEQRARARCHPAS